MIPIQAILLVLIFVLGWFILSRSRSQLTVRLVMLLLLLILTVFVLVPDITTWIANRLGVGRGTDLLFYAFAIFTLYSLTLFHLRLRRLDARMTVLARELAILKARPQPDLPPTAQRDTNTASWKEG